MTYAFLINFNLINELSIFGLLVIDMGIFIYLFVNTYVSMFSKAVGKFRRVIQHHNLL